MKIQINLDKYSLYQMLQILY